MDKSTQKQLGQGQKASTKSSGSVPSTERLSQASETSNTGHEHKSLSKMDSKPIRKGQKDLTKSVQRAGNAAKSGGLSQASSTNPIDPDQLTFDEMDAKNLGPCSFLQTVSPVVIEDINRISSTISMYGEKYNFA
jgi:hypothetical protein